jgi:hypothetical protein
LLTCISGIPVHMVIQYAKLRRTKYNLNSNSILDFFSYLVQIRFLLTSSQNDKDSKIWQIRAMYYVVI